MALGPGKYDDACTVARESTEAEAAILIILGGKFGSGFSAQMRNSNFAKELPGLLRTVADDIDREYGP